MDIDDFERIIEPMLDEIERYKKAYYILMEYFDSISDEEKPKVNKRLEELGV